MSRGSWFFHLPVGVTVIFYFCFALIWTVDCHKVNRRQAVDDLLSNTRSDQASFPIDRATSKQDPSVFDIYQPLRDPSVVGELQGNATPGITYPTLTTTVKTNFTCRGLKGPGWYADIETGCQQYHRCYSEIRSTAFICPPGTLFSQETLICDFWYNVNCAAARGLYEYANSRLYKFGVPLHGDTKWTPPPITGAPPTLARVEITGRPTVSTTRRTLPTAPIRIVQNPAPAPVAIIRTVLQPASTQPPVTLAPFVQPQPFMLAAGRTYEFNASSVGIAQASAVVDTALAQATRNTSSSTNTSGQICVIVIQIPQVNHHGPNSVNYTTVNQSGVVSVSQYCRIQRTPAEVQLLQQQAQPGISYPVYSSVVNTNFTCRGLNVPGWYEEPQTFCQQYYYCDEHGTATANLCSPSTLFNQATLTCDVWYNVVCNGSILYNSTTYGSLYLLHGQVTNGVVTSGATHHDSQGQEVVAQQSGGNRFQPAAVPVVVQIIVPSTTGRPTSTPRTTSRTTTSETTTTEETTEEVAEATTEVVMIPKSTTIQTLSSTTARRRSVIASFNLTSNWAGGSVQDLNGSTNNTSELTSPKNSNILVLHPVNNSSVPPTNAVLPTTTVPVTTEAPVDESETVELTTLTPSTTILPSFSTTSSSGKATVNGSSSGVIDQSDVLVFKPVILSATVPIQVTTTATAATLEGFTVEITEGATTSTLQPLVNPVVTTNNTKPFTIATLVSVPAANMSQFLALLNRTTIPTGNLSTIGNTTNVTPPAEEEQPQGEDTAPTNGQSSPAVIISNLPGSQVSVTSNDSATVAASGSSDINATLPSRPASAITQNITLVALQHGSGNSPVNTVISNDTRNHENETDGTEVSVVTTTEKSSSTKGSIGIQQPLSPFIAPNKQIQSSTSQSVVTVNNAITDTTIKSSTNSVAEEADSNETESAVVVVSSPVSTTTTRRIVVGAGKPRPTWWSPPVIALSTLAARRIPVATTTATPLKASPVILGRNTVLLSANKTVLQTGNAAVTAASSNASNTGGSQTAANSGVIVVGLNDMTAAIGRLSTQVTTTVSVTTRGIAGVLTSTAAPFVSVNGSSSIFSSFSTNDNEENTSNDGTTQEKTSTVTNVTPSTSSNKLITATAAANGVVIVRLNPVSQVGTGTTNVTAGNSQILNGIASSVAIPVSSSNITLLTGTKGSTQRVPVTTTVASAGPKARVTWWVPKVAGPSVTRARTATTASAGTLLAVASASRPTATVTQPTTTSPAVTTTAATLLLVPLVVDGKAVAVQSVNNEPAESVSPVSVTTLNEEETETTSLPALIPLPTSYNQTALVAFGEKSDNVSQAAAMLHRPELSNNTTIDLVSASNLSNVEGQNDSFAGLVRSDIQVIPTTVQSVLVIPSVVGAPIFVNGSSSIFSSFNNTGKNISSTVTQETNNESADAIETANRVLAALNATLIAAGSGQAQIGAANTTSAPTVELIGSTAQTTSVSLSSNQTALMVLPGLSNNVTVLVDGNTSLNTSSNETVNIPGGNVIVVSGNSGTTLRVPLTTTVAPSGSKAKVTWWVPQGVGQSVTKASVATTIGAITAVTGAPRPTATATQFPSTSMAQNQLVLVPLPNKLVATAQNVNDASFSNHAEGVSLVRNTTLDEQPPSPSLIPIPAVLDQTALVGFGDTSGNLSRAVAALHRTELSNSSVDGSSGQFLTSVGLPNMVTLTQSQSGLDSVSAQVPMASSSNVFLTATVPPTTGSDATNSTESSVGFRTIRYLEHRLIVRIGPFHLQKTSNETTTPATNISEASTLPEVVVSSTAAVPRQFRQLRRLR